MHLNLVNLETESRNMKTTNIDILSTEEILHLINEEDATVASCVNKVIPKITELVDEIVKAIKNGGRLFYIGAGTSGRIGFLDAAECPPTYGVSYDLVKGIIAGGYSALYKAKEGSEDDYNLAELDLKAENFNSKDILIGIAASGRTPYVLGALAYAKSTGAITGSIACVSNSEIGKVSDYLIDVVTGQEVITGSTRMKAGTAQKLILNMISTTTMIKLGKVYGNLMVDLNPTNEKLVARAIHFIEEATSCSTQRAQTLFEESGQCVKTAILMELANLSKDEANQLLEKNDQILKNAINNFNK